MAFWLVTQIKTQYSLQLKLHNSSCDEYTMKCYQDKLIYCCLNEQMQLEVNPLSPQHLRQSSLQQNSIARNRQLLLQRTPP